jgi:hypothetical protein
VVFEVFSSWLGLDLSIVFPLCLCLHRHSLEFATIKISFKSLVAIVDFISAHELVRSRDLLLERSVRSSLHRLLPLPDFHSVLPTGPLEGQIFLSASLHSGSTGSEAHHSPIAFSAALFRASWAPFLVSFFIHASCGPRLVAFCVQGLIFVTIWLSFGFPIVCESLEVISGMIFESSAQRLEDSWV